MDGAGALDRFEPYGEIIGVDEEAGVGEECGETGRQDGSLEDDAGWQERSFAFIGHPGDEDEEGEREAAKEAHDAR